MNDTPQPGGSSPAGTAVAPPPVDPPRPTPSLAPPAAAPTAAWGLPLAVLILGMFMSILDTTIVNIAITNIRKDFGVTIEDAQWISTAYGLTEGAVVPISAWLGNRVGHRRLYIWSVALFTFFSLLCGISSNLGEMIVFRILQAIPGGMIPVTCITLVFRMVPPQKIGSAMGLFGLGVTMAPGLGPAVGGYLVEFVSWPWIYWVNIPIGIATVVAASVVLPRVPGLPGTPLDRVGFFLIVSGLFALLLALEKGGTWGWGSYRVLGLLALGVNLLVLWVISQFQVKHPMLDMRAFKSFDFVKSLILIGLLFCGMFAMLFNVPQFLQNVQGQTPWHTGLVTLPYAVILMIMMPTAGRIYDRFGSRWPATIGMIIAGIGLVMLANLRVQSTIQSVVIAQAVVGLGLGTCMMPIMTGGLSVLPPALNDSGGALNTLGQRVSQAFSTAVLTAMINADKAQFFSDQSALMPGRGANTDAAVTQLAQQGPGGLVGMWQQVNGMAQTTAYSNAFLVAAALVFAGVGLALTLPTGRPSGAGGAVAH